MLFTPLHNIGLTLELTLRAAKDIPEGTHLTTSYCDILWPTAQRQQYLQWSKFFICNCRRCQDPTELGSFLSALICPRCPHTSALLSPNLNTIDKLQQGLTRDFDYICTECNHNFPSEFIEHFISTAEEQLQLLDKEEAAEDKAAEYEVRVLCEFYISMTFEIHAHVQLHGTA